MSNSTLSILAKITNTALTGNTQENVMQNTNPFPAAWLVENETPVTVTVTRNGSTIAACHATDGAAFIEAPVPTNDGGRCITTVRNTRDWDYVVRGLLLNGLVQLGDLVEVKQANAWSPVARLEFIEVTLAPVWSRDGIRQPVENKMVVARANSKRYYNDGGYWADRVTGTTDPVTGLVEAELSRW
jgi:hypothetical protein